MELTVQDALNRPLFKNAKVIAGENGLNRRVNWVHIVEINKFGHLLNGQEIILTTGVEWTKDKTKGLHFMEQLITHNSSALCIETEKQNGNFSKEMLLLADKNNIPIIVFNKEVKFVDITKDLHEVLLGYRENSWWSLENLYKRFNDTLVSGGTIGEFLKVLHKSTKKQIVLIHNDNQFHFFPSPPAKQQKKWVKQIQDSPKDFCTYPVNFLNETVAKLYLLEDRDKVSFTHDLSAKRCSEFISQYFWKYYQQREVHQIKENEWLLQIYNGTMSHEKATELFKQNNPEVDFKQAIVGVIPESEGHISIEKNNSVITMGLMLIRSIFHSKGFNVLTVKDESKNCYVLLLINKREDSTFFLRITEATRHLFQSNIDGFSKEDIRLISFGKEVNSFKMVRESYQTSLISLNFQQSISPLQPPFYKNLAVYRLIDQSNDVSHLREIIYDYIGPIISYDQQNGTELLKTLKVYLKNLGSKKSTADELYIVRQTLYHRLNRIKLLIGEDFMDPEKRIMIETAIYFLMYFKKMSLISV
ncbi:PucR family transcriptional regulator [Virgibacillus siamensis]|uniref:PucR family transcriptional regulator n=1 Tax=Virgibacillus siamensis TaxID=480071 RepID=UPI00158AFA1C|nr:PucR family transcriptional regulator [Virgibacillus siamensis]